MWRFAVRHLAVSGLVLAGCGFRPGVPDRRLSFSEFTIVEGGCTDNHIGIPVTVHIACGGY